MKQKEAKTKLEKANIQSKLVDLVDAHPRQPRCQYFGEELQMDACIHLWFGKTKTALYAAIDDATGNIVGAYFDNQETLNGYYNKTHQIMKKDINTIYGLHKLEIYQKIWYNISISYVVFALMYRRNKMLFLLILFIIMDVCSFIVAIKEGGTEYWISAIFIAVILIVVLSAVLT